MLEEAKPYPSKNEASLLEQAIILIQYALAHTPTRGLIKKKNLQTFTGLAEQAIRPHRSPTRFRSAYRLADFHYLDQQTRP